MTIRAKTRRKRWLANIKIDKKTGCWLWQGRCFSDGYGQITVNYKTWYAHRLSYILHFGFPGNLFVCHTCDVKNCVDPKHLWLGTNKDNQLDAVSKGRNHNKSKTHCSHGHEYTKENTHIRLNKSRQCRACDRIQTAKRRSNYD